MGLVCLEGSILWGGPWSGHRYREGQTAWPRVMAGGQDEGMGVGVTAEAECGRLSSASEQPRSPSEKVQRFVAWVSE